MRNLQGRRPAILIVALIAYMGGCNSEFTQDKDDQNLSYTEYCKRIALRGFDPKGARTINVAGHTERDGYDSWWRMEISRDDWLAICREI